MPILFIKTEKIHAGDSDARMWEFLDEDGNPIDLSESGRSLTMYLQKRGTSDTPVTKSIVNGVPNAGEAYFATDGTDGRVQFLLESADTDHEGEVWKRWFRMQNSLTSPAEDYTYARGLVRFIEPCLGT